MFNSNKDESMANVAFQTGDSNRRVKNQVQTNILVPTGVQ
jgi:hypothetical protein